MVLCCLFRCQSFSDVTSYVCALYFEFGLACRVTTFWERAIHLVGRVFSLNFIYLFIKLFLILVLRAEFGF